MRIVAFLSDPPVVGQILEHLDLPVRAPPFAPARGPPWHELLSLDPPSPSTSAGSSPDHFGMLGGHPHIRACQPCSAPSESSRTPDAALVRSC